MLFWEYKILLASWWELLNVQAFCFHVLHARRPLQSTIHQPCKLRTSRPWQELTVPAHQETLATDWSPSSGMITLAESYPLNLWRVLSGFLPVPFLVWRTWKVNTVAHFFIVIINLPRAILPSQEPVPSIYHTSKWTNSQDNSCNNTLLWFLLVWGELPTVLGFHMQLTTNWFELRIPVMSTFWDMCEARGKWGGAEQENQSLLETVAMHPFLEAKPTWHMKYICPGLPRNLPLSSGGFHQRVGVGGVHTSEAAQRKRLLSWQEEENPCSQEHILCQVHEIKTAKAVFKVQMGFLGV